VVCIGINTDERKFEKKGSKCTYSLDRSVKWLDDSYPQNPKLTDRICLRKTYDSSDELNTNFSNLLHAN